MAEPCLNKKCKGINDCNKYNKHPENCIDYKNMETLFLETMADIAIEESRINEIVDKINSIGCTSFMLNGEVIE